MLLVSALFVSLTVQIQRSPRESDNEEVNHSKPALSFKDVVEAASMQPQREEIIETISDVKELSERYSGQSQIERQST